MREDQRTCQIRGTEYETAVNIIAVWKSVPVVGKAAGVINQQKMKGCWKDEKEEE